MRPLRQTSTSPTWKPSPMRPLRLMKDTSPYSSAGAGASAMVSTLATYSGREEEEKEGEEVRNVVKLQKYLFKISYAHQTLLSLLSSFAFLCRIARSSRTLLNHLPFPFAFSRARKCLQKIIPSCPASAYPS